MPADAVILLQRISQRNEGALGELYDAYSGALYGMLLGMVNEEQLAQELLQDTFISIWQNAKSYDELKGRPYTWMLRIARNKALDKLRSAPQKRKAMIQSLDSSVHKVKDDSTQKDLEGAEVSSIVSKLRTEHRELIEMAYFQGYSQQEISDGTGLPLGTVKSRTRSALQQLRSLLKDHR